MRTPLTPPYREDISGNHSAREQSWQISYEEVWTIAFLSLTARWRDCAKLAIGSAITVEMFQKIENRVIYVLKYKYMKL